MRRNHRNGTVRAPSDIVSNYVHGALTALIACRAQVITEIRPPKYGIVGRQILPSTQLVASSIMVVLPTVGRCWRPRHLPTAMTTAYVVVFFPPQLVNS